MKTVSAPLLAHLQAGGPFVMADLYTVTLASGEAFHWADFDQDVVHPVNGYTYVATGPVLSRGKTRSVIGVNVDTLDVSLYGRSSDLIDGLPLLSAARAGAFDGARLVLERAFLSPAPTAVGVIHLFSGRFADVSLSRTEMQVRINSDAEAFNVQLPRNIYQPGCIHTLYDAGCGLARATWGLSSSVGSGSTAAAINCGLSQAAGWFTRGYIKFTSGALLGVERTVKQYAPGSIGLFLPLPAPPAIGDTFIAYPGCDKLQATCSGKFANLPQFRGCPYIPVPETAL